MDKYIAKQIVLAQVASDGGKGQDDVLSRISSFLPIGEIYCKKVMTRKTVVLSRQLRQYNATHKAGLSIMLK